ncbi:MAG: tetratricopeptide repeat protein [Bacteroidetes bacterium]|nr:tetratricopeptide repeat protein [Bacteroidota bacterium]
MKHHSYIVLFLAATFLSGCAVWNPVADVAVSGYVNTVSYFNSFYNAQRLFNEAEDEVIKSRTEFLERGGLGKPFTIPSAARQKFQTSIEKNSKVLSFYPDARWVDDALLMIGKAYYYMEDDVRSERKFQELAVKFPESGLIPEANLWLGKSLLRQKKSEQGLKMLEELVAQRDAVDADLSGNAAYEMANYHFQRKDHREAERFYRIAADLVSDDELLTLIYFRLGDCSMELSQNQKAFEAYGSARSVSPVYSLIFQAHLQQVKIIAANGGYEEALAVLDGMLSDSKNAEYFAAVHFQIAQVLYKQGRTAEAVEKYRYIDTAFVRTDEAARSYFLLGRHFETVEGRYDSARVMYNRARAEFAASEITPEAVQKADMFNKYFDLWRELAKFDSLSRMEMNRPLESDSAVIGRDSAAVLDSIAVRPDPKVKKMAKTVKPDVKKDSVLAADSLRMRERLRKEEEKARLLDSLQRTIARVKFELGGLFFLEIQQPDSALRWFDDVITGHAATPYAPRALYTKAEMFRTELNKPQTELEAVYSALIDTYSNSAYANEARKILGRPLVVEQVDTAAVQFEQAERLADANDIAAAVQLLKRTARQFPLSPYAARSLYTAGWHYEHSLSLPDSAIAQYQLLIAQHPASALTGKVRGKVMEYEAEQKRLEEEKQAAKKAEEEAKAAAEELKKKPKRSAAAPADSLGAKQNPMPTDTLSTPNEQ